MISVCNIFINGNVADIKIDDLGLSTLMRIILHTACSVRLPLSLLLSFSSVAIQHVGRLTLPLADASVPDLCKPRPAYTPSPATDALDPLLFPAVA